MKSVLIRFTPCLLLLSPLLASPIASTHVTCKVVGFDAIHTPDESNVLAFSEASGNPADCSLGGSTFADAAWTDFSATVSAFGSPALIDGVFGFGRAHAQIEWTNTFVITGATGALLLDVNVGTHEMGFGCTPSSSSALVDRVDEPNNFEPFATHFDYLFAAEAGVPITLHLNASADGVGGDGGSCSLFVRPILLSLDRAELTSALLTSVPTPEPNTLYLLVASLALIFIRKDR